MADMLVLLRPPKSLQNGAGFRGKNLSILGLPKRIEWPQYYKDSSWQERLSRSCQKEKEQSNLPKSSDREVEESESR